MATRHRTNFNVGGVASPNDGSHFLLVLKTSAFEHQEMEDIREPKAPKILGAVLDNTGVNRSAVVINRS